MSPHTKIDTLILSDLHLGSPIGKPALVRSLLTHHRFKRLILLGDIFDYHANYHKLDDEHMDLVALLRSFREMRDREIIWIRGNHDHNRDGELSRFIGANILEEYAWKHDGKEYLAIHGDQFDSFVHNQSNFNAWAHVFFLGLQRLDKKGRHIVKIIDYANASIRRLSSKIARGAIRHALRHGADYVFCGHTHIAKKLVHESNGTVIHYYNTGCWTHTPSTFAVIDDRGEIMLEKFS